jgi:hypothetical protein
LQRIWQAFGLQPHGIEAFKLSTDPVRDSGYRDVADLSYHEPRFPAQLHDFCDRVRWMVAIEGPLGQTPASFAMAGL